LADQNEDDGSVPGSCSNRGRIAFILTTGIATLLRVNSLVFSFDCVRCLGLSVEIF
jgi:hypothetical protein